MEVSKVFAPGPWRVSDSSDLRIEETVDRILGQT